MKEMQGKVEELWALDGVLGPRPGGRRFMGGLAQNAQNWNKAEKKFLSSYSLFSAQQSGKIRKTSKFVKIENLEGIFLKLCMEVKFEW